MQFTMKTGELMKGVRLASGAAERKTTAPVLQNVLLSTSGKESVEITATDLTLTTTARLVGTVGKSGSVVVNAKKLSEIVSSIASQFPDGDVSMERLDNEGALIKSGKIECKLVGVKADEFPRIPKPTGTRLFKVKRANLEKMISRTLFAVANDEVRRNLSGVCIDTVEGDKVRMIATDGHRLSMVEAALGGDVDVNFGGVIVPKKGITEFRRILAEAGDEVEIGLLQNQIILSTADVLTSTKLIEGRFPDYMQYIPKDNDKTLIVDRNGFIGSLRRMKILSGNNNVVRIKLKKGSLTVTSDDPLSGEGREEMDADYAGPALDVALNAGFL
ncbi:MAG: DNA polymerase III subunit beta, partial [Myxococcota bacterium]